MFEITAPIGAARCEPLLQIGPEAARRSRPSPQGAGAEDTRREPSLAPRMLSPQAPPPPPSERPIASNAGARPWGPVGSLLLHLLPVLLLLLMSRHPLPEIATIPVQLVLVPPPPPPVIKPSPKPVPKPKPEKRPPPGRIASADMGDPNAKGRNAEKTPAPAPVKQPAENVETPLEAPQQTAFLPPPPTLADPPRLDLPAPSDPRPIATPRPPHKPAFAAHQPLRPVPERARQLPRWAPYPGPAATRDEYLAYLAYLAHQHIGLLSRTVVGGRRGETIVNVLVLDDGTVARLSIGVSSGYRDIDERVEDMIRAVGRFPPLPQWFQGDSMRLEFRLQFPEALDD